MEGADTENLPIKQEEKIKQPEASLKKKKSPEEVMLGIVKKDWVAYVSGAVYTTWETLKSESFVTHAPNFAPFWSRGLTRETEGLRGMFDQNIGDGTVAFFGFMGAEGILLTIDAVGKKLGKKGINPEIRFLSSLTFGVALATYLETTTVLGNTVDIPGDFFGVALGAAAILTGKVVHDHIRSPDAKKVIGKKASALRKEIPEKLKMFGQKLGESLKRGSDKPDIPQKELVVEFLEIVNTNQ